MDDPLQDPVARTARRSRRGGAVLLPTRDRIAGWPSWADGPDAAERRAARLWLLVVAVGFLAIQVGLVGLDRPVNWDEAIHLTQVDPNRLTVFMEPHRTRGLSLVVAPVAVFDPSMVVLRLFLALAGAAGTYAAFATWVPTIGAAAPVAAGAYSVHWVTVFYSVEVLPNHPTALLTVAATGLVAQLLTGRASDRRWMLAAAGVFALAASIRPPDAVLVGVGVGLVLLALHGRRAFRPLMALAVGGVAGLVPWLVEGAVRFGFGPITTVRSASEYSVDGDTVNLAAVYLKSLETQLRCAGDCLADAGGWGLPPIRTTLFLLVAGILTVVAIGTAGRRWPVVPVIAMPMVLLIAFYGLAGGVMNLRYLMPVFALGLLLPAVGGLVLWRAVFALGSGWRSLNVAVALVLVATGWWQVGLALDRFDRPHTRDRAQELGLALAAEAGDDPCVVATRVNYPQIQYWSGCHAVVLERGRDGQIQAPLGELGSYVDVAALGRVGYRVFAITTGGVAEDSPVRSWLQLPLDIEYPGDFALYEHRPGDPLPPPPCPPEGTGPERTLAGVLSDRC